MAAPNKDDVTGQETTGHEWDGIKELNTPLPKWWLMIIYASIIWSIGYWILYPAWPTLTGNTKGLFDWSSRVAVTEQLDAAKAARQVFVQRIAEANLEAIEKDPELLTFALAGGRSAFGDNCAGCHGSAAQGTKGYPNLADDDWLWGGSLDAIQQTILYGVRSGHDENRAGDMPAFGLDETLTPTEIAAAADYVRSLSGLDNDREKARAGKAVFAENCADCHGNDGKGKRDVGAVNLTDAIWLYGSDRETVIETIAGGRKGVMPHWDGRLSPETIKQLAVYVHALGGGE